MNALFAGILPGGASRQLRIRRASYYLVGCSIGGGLVGAVLGFVGGQIFPWPRAYSLLGVSLFSLIYALPGLRLVMIPFPELGRTVPSHWGRSGMRGMLQWGLTNGGLAFSTRVSFPAYYVVLAWALMMGDTLYGTLIGLTYGVTRSLPSVLYCIPQAPGGKTHVKASMAILSLKDRVHTVHGFALLLFGLGVLGYLYLGTDGLGDG